MDITVLLRINREHVSLRPTIGKVSPPSSQAEQMGHIFLSITLAQDKQTVKHLVTLSLSLFSGLSYLQWSNLIG